MTTARDLMNTSTITITPRLQVRHAVELLRALEIRHLPVVDERGAFVGMLSDRDLRSVAIPVHVEAGSSTGRTLDKSVAEILSSDVFAAVEGAAAAEVIDRMLEHRVGLVPVVDDEGIFVGSISYLDVLRAITDVRR